MTLRRSWKCLKIRRVFELISVLYAAAMILCSYRVYVVPEVQMTQELRDIFWEYFRDVLFFYFWVVYLHYAIRYCVWRKCCTFPSYVKVKLTLLFIISILWVLLVQIGLRNVMNYNMICSPFLVWLIDAIYYIPFLVPWVFWGSGIGCRAALREKLNEQCRQLTSSHAL